MTQYPTDLTEKQWQVIKNILEPQARNRKHSLKEIMNATTTSTYRFNKTIATVTMNPIVTVAIII